MRRTLGLVFLFVAFASLASGQTTPTTRLIPYSGTALDASGAPLTSEVATIFELYEEQEGGAALWSETQHVQTDERGRYLVYLGSVTAMPQGAFTEERARWLAITIDGRELPRVMLVAVPYALRAADADTLGGQPASSFVRSRADGRLETSAGVVAEAAVEGSGATNQLAKFSSPTTVTSSIITESATNQIGIGTADPTEGGQLASKVTIRASDGTTALAISNQAGTPRFALNVNGDGSWITYDRGSGFFQPGIAQRGGRVGISTTDPTGGGVVDSKFTVRNLDNNTGIAVLNQFDARRFALNTQSDGSWRIYDGGGGIWNPGLSQRNGRVGIGVDPIARLDVWQPGSGFAGWFENGVSAVPALVATTNGTRAGLAAGTFNTAGVALTLEVPFAGSSDMMRGATVDGTGFRTERFRIDRLGNVFANQYFLGGADFAEEIEPLRSPNAYVPGDVLVITGEKDRAVDVARDPYSTRVIGVYSTKPGILGSPHATGDPRHAGMLPMAMIGIVPCKVSAENGPIAHGDLLVTSTTAGHAMKGTDHTRMTGAIVGKALESLAAGTGTILIAVTLQ